MHIFDLDLTLWETFDKRGNPIWAKQLIFPLSKVDVDVVCDDVGSKCVLRKGVRDYLSKLRERNCQIGYLSSGRHWNFDDNHQPSLHLLELFEISEFFNAIKVLNYKSRKKSDFLKHADQKIIFYDDDEGVIKDLSSLSHIFVVDAKSISDWSKVEGFKID